MVSMEFETLPEKAVEKLLEMGAEEAAAIASLSRSGQVRFSNNQVTVVGFWDRVTLSVLVRRDRRVVAASTTDLSEEGLERLFRQTVSASRIIKPREHYAPLPKGPFEYPEVTDTFDPSLETLRDEAVGMVEEAVSSALDEGAVRAAGTFSYDSSETRLYTSAGASGSFRSSGAILFVRAFSDGEASGMGVTCGTSLSDLRPSDAGEEAGRIAGLCRESEPGRAGEYDVVFGRPAVAVLFDILAGMSSAFYVDSGLSCLDGKVGSQVASEVLTVHDDGTLPSAMGSRPFDDEGFPTYRKPILERGVLKGYLHNTLTAAKFGVETTGNAGWIVPHPWNVVVEAGDVGDEELMAEVRDGLYVHNLTYVRFQDYRAGDFSGIVRDGVLHVKDGEPVAAVRGLRLSENLLELLKKVKAVSKEVRQVSHWWMEWGSPAVFAPTILASKVRFTTPTA